MEYQTVFDYVSNQGIAITTTVGVMVIAYKYINKIINENMETQTKILFALDSILDKLENENLKNDTLRLVSRMRVRSLLEEYKSKVLVYIAVNNIKVNLRTIKLEIESYQKESLTKTKELLEDRVKSHNLELVVNEIKNSFSRIDEVIMPIFEELALEHNFCSANLMREIDKHFEREIAISIENMILLKLL